MIFSSILTSMISAQHQGTGGCVPIVGAEQIIGAYAGYTSFQPFYGLYNYSLSAQIFTPADFTQANCQITGIHFYNRSFTTPYNLINQEIWIGEVSDSVFPSSPKTDFSDLTFIKPLVQVANGTVNITTNYVWNGFLFDTHYCYDGVNNIVIVWKNNDGSWQSGYGQFQHSSSTSKGMYTYWDVTQPATGTRSNNRTLFKLDY